MCRNLNILIARPSPPHQSYSARCSPNICQFVRCEPENRGLSRQPGRRVTPPPTGLAVHHKCDEQIHFGRVGESLKDAQNIKAESSCNVAAADHLWRAHHCVSALHNMTHCPLPICAPYSVESAQQPASVKKCQPFVALMTAQLTWPARMSRHTCEPMIEIMHKPAFIVGSCMPAR